MNATDRYDVLVLGCGTAGKLVAWTMAKEGKRTAVVERQYIGGSCPNVACLPSKNVIHSAKVASLMARHREFGLETGQTAVDMTGVYRRKREMVDGIVQVHLDKFRAAGDELILGHAIFVAPRTVQVALNDGGERIISADRVFLNLGSHATIPGIPGLRDSIPMTHIEALNLRRLPQHVIVLGGGYVGLELSQALRRFGSQVTVINRSSQLASNEDADVSQAILQLFRDEGIDVLLNAQTLRVIGVSGDQVWVEVRDRTGVRTLHGTDILVAAGRTPNTSGIALDKAGIEITEKGHIRVNDRLETTAPNVYAMGDCAGSPYFTHVAEDDFSIIHDNLNGGQRSTNDRLIPYCVFIEGIVPLVSHSPLISWHFQVFGPYVGSDIIGATEWTAALLLTVGYFKPKAGIVGCLIATLMFFITSTTLITTPGAIISVPGIPGMRYMSFIGLFLFKDVISLGVALYLISYFGQKATNAQTMSIGLSGSKGNSR